MFKVFFQLLSQSLLLPLRLLCHELKKEKGACPLSLTECLIFDFPPIQTSVCREGFLTSVFHNQFHILKEEETSEGRAETETVNLTFAEVMKLVQEGKEVPGVKKLDIQPTNQDPAPSRLQRIQKPWEKSLHSQCRIRTRNSPLVERKDGGSQGHSRNGPNLLPVSTAHVVHVGVVFGKTKILENRRDIYKP
ncbi:hypothetical protein WMY93_031444 [Mugilogobius chulae]|uniref:Peroxisomal membrane protein PEX14-like KPWE domain-containing protein n=1 Tax=Mugilogobius chulae TaxID=88201 RepID=A0AAW0MFN0_9GOBI